MASERVSFLNDRGETLSGVLEIPEQPVAAWAIFAHCFTCSKTSLAASRIARGLAERGIGVLRFDFTGLGESDGDFSGTGFSTNVSDLLTALDWMAEHHRPVSLMVGHSLGGAATIVAAQQAANVKAVATIGAPSDADHVIEQFKQSVPDIEKEGAAEVNLGGRPFRLTKSFLDDVRNSSVRDAAGQLKRPLMIFHAPTDDVVGIENATGLFLAAKHPKSFISLDKANHLLTRAEDADFVSDMIASWARRYVSTSEKNDVATDDGETITVRETLAAGPYQNEIIIAGQRHLADEPKSVGGMGTGPDPYDWVTAGLGACTSMTLRMYANHKGWPLDRVTVNLTHEKRHAEDCVDCGPKDRIDVFSRVIQIEGDLDETQRQRLLEIADRCPVHRTLESSSHIETQLATKPA